MSRLRKHVVKERMIFVTTFFYNDRDHKPENGCFALCAFALITQIPKRMHKNVILYSIYTYAMNKLLNPFASYSHQSQHKRKPT